MADKTHIQWTDATWNIITGCTLVDDGCRYCYAASLAATRLKHHPSREGLARLNLAGEAKFTGEVRFNKKWLLQPLQWTKPRMIFVCAHGDLFHESVPDEWLDQIFAIMALASHHTFQVLTKRPDRALVYLQHGSMTRAAAHLEGLRPSMLWNGNVHEAERRLTYGNPLPNVWLGTSASDQASADARIPDLLAAPAAVRFLSAEPLLGAIDLTSIPHSRIRHDIQIIQNALTGSNGLGQRPYVGLDWVIVGGESGKKARPMHPQWARDIRDQCVAAGVPYFFKQNGEWVSVSEVAGPGDHFRFPDGATVRRTGKALAGRTLDGREWNEMPGVRP